MPSGRDPREHEVNQRQHDDQGPSLDGNRNRKDHHIGIGPVGRERQRHTHYRTRGADERDQRGQLTEAEREQRRAHATIEIEKEELPRPHPGLDRGAEEVENQHVRGQMQQAGVDEHVGEQGPRSPESASRIQPECRDYGVGSEKRGQQQLHDYTRRDESSHHGGRSGQRRVAEGHCS